MSTPSQPQKLYDAINTVSGGINAGASPLDLPPATLAGAINVTVRGGDATHRSAYHKRAITWADEEAGIAFTTGYFQGACTYFSDNQETSLIVAVSGRIYQLLIDGDTVTGSDVTGISTVGPVQPQAWLWQAEKWVIIQDGLNQCRFFDGATTTDSNPGTRTNYTSALAGPFDAGLGIPQPGTSDTIDFTGVANLFVGDLVTFQNWGSFQVQEIVGVKVKLLNLNATPPGTDVDAPTVVSWSHSTGIQLPPGRMGCYGMGRIWMSLIDGKQFLASDIRGGASGTPALDRRDAILNITENFFLKGGGNFAVPGSVGEIRAMRFVANLDTSLGQGALQVFTHSTVFSCNAPVDRLKWQDISNPILTESLIGFGAMGQWSTVGANSDTLFRSLDGVRSLILARREFATWGNTPISFEVSPYTNTDDPGLLSWSSAIVFDNRLLMTVGTTSHAQGKYFRGLIPLNFDPLSSIRGKEPSVWDSSIWMGLNVLQLLVCEVDKVERAFAFNMSLVDGIELWEIKKSYNPNVAAAVQPNASIYDNDGEVDIPITWQLDSPSLRFGVQKWDHKLLALSNGEIWVSDVQGTVMFTTQWRPDQYPCWTNWISFSTCQAATSSSSRPGFLPRMGFNTPPGMDAVTRASNCDASTGRPLRNGFTFQVRTIIRGHCVLQGEFFEATVENQSEYAFAKCGTLCSPITI